MNSERHLFADTERVLLYTLPVFCTLFLAPLWEVDRVRAEYRACTDRATRELLTQGRPLFLGVDGKGAAHYWDSYEFAVAIVSADGDAEKVVLAETPFETLAEWCEYTRGSLVGDLVRGVGMSCTVEERKRVRRAARAIRDDVATESVDVLAPNASQYGVWTLDTVLRELALAGLALQPTPSQAEYQHVAATV